MCFLSLTLAAKLIGTIGMSMSILILNMIISDFFSRNTDEEFLIALESWMLFGLNWTYVIKSLQVMAIAHRLLTCVLIYSSFALVANGLLALGSVWKNPSYALPWLYYQMINIIDQTVALGVHLTQEGEYERFERSIWYVPIGSMYLVLSTYFWLIVSSARKEWIMSAPSYYMSSEAIIHQQSSSRDFNLPKTPSFLSSNIPDYSLDYPKPIPPPKYDIV